MTGSPLARPRAGPLVATVGVLALLTIGVRVAGFARNLTFAATVGSTDLGMAYQTANAVPNIVFEVVAGGLLAAAVVPLLAGVDRDRAGAIASSLLAWTLGVLVPVAAVVAIAAEPIAGALLGSAEPAITEAGARMLRIFAVQIPLYGVGMVLTGVLHAHHRFVWPVLAPLLSSVTAIATYAAFALLAAPGATLATAGRPAEVVLAVGTTVAVAVLTGCLIIPVRRLGLVWRWRPSPGTDVRRRMVTLAGATAVGVAAQQLAAAMHIRLANGGPVGSVVLLALAQTVFLLPWAVLVVPWVTTVFPRLAAAAGPDEFDALLRRAMNGVLLGAGLGVAALIGLARPLGEVLAELTAGQPSPGTLAGAIGALAAGLPGFAAIALLGRALIAAGLARPAAVVAVAGWGVTAALGLLAAPLAPAPDRVVALAVAYAVGVTVQAALLAGLWVRRRGCAGLRPGRRTLAVVVVATIMAGGLGWAIGTLAGPPLVRVVLAAAAIAVGYAGVVLVGDRRFVATLRW